VAQTAATRAGVRRRARRTPAWGFVLPYVVLLVSFGVAPAIYGLYQAFLVTPVIGPTRFDLFANFVAVLSDFRLPRSALNVLTYLAIWLPALLVLVFGLALVMDQKRTRFAALTRFVTFVPGAVTGASAALLWLFMFSPTVSPIGPFLRLFTSGNESFLTDSTIVVVLAVMGLAGGTGGWVVVVYGALTDVPRDLLEAARLDGANAWQTIWHIKLPLIRSYAYFILIISTAAGFQVFVEPTLLGNGAPGQVSTTWSLNQLVFTYATQDANYGKSAALSVVLLVVCTALAVTVIKGTKFYSIEDRS
jgi:multiple sugar transport system permease protein